MRKWWLLPLLAVAACLMTAQVASAHVLKTDGSIGAVLHIQPDDAPTAKVPVTFELSFQDHSGAFSLKDCNCSIAFVANDQTVQTLPLAATTATTSEDTITFPEAAIYTFRITGSPKNGAAFQPFMLEYPVRVGGGQADQRPMPPLLRVGMGMAFGLVLLAGYATSYAESKEGK